MGVFAVCLSGGYKDDADEGATFWYTGVGGQGKGGHGAQWSAAAAHAVVVVCGGVPELWTGRA